MLDSNRNLVVETNAGPKGDLWDDVLDKIRANIGDIEQGTANF